MKFLIIIFTSFFFSGCLSLSSIQTGRTVGKDNLDAGIYSTYGKYSQNSVLGSASDLDNKMVFGVKSNYGLTDKMDIGINIDQTTFIAPSIKYQFLGNNSSKFAARIGTEGGFLFGAYLFGNLTYYLSAPLYTSFHPNSNYAVYCTPRFIHTAEYIYAHPDRDIKPHYGKQINTFGYSYGIIFGKKYKIAIEISHYLPQLHLPSQFSVGYKFNFRSK